MQADQLIKIVIEFSRRLLQRAKVVTVNELLAVLEMQVVEVAGLVRKAIK